MRVMQLMDKTTIEGSAIHGVTQLILSWIEEFENYSIDTVLCVLREEDEAREKFESLGVSPIYLARSKLNPFTIVDLICLIKNKEIDIVHCHGYGATTFGRIACLLTGRSAIIHEHAVLEKIPFYQKIADYFLAPFTHIGFAVSSAVQEFMTNNRYVNRKKIKVLPNGVPDSFFIIYTEQQKKKIRNKIGIQLGKLAIGIIGRLDKNKGHKVLLSAIVKLLQTRSDFIVLIAGEGEMRSELERYTNDHRLDKYVKFLGFRSDIRDLMASIDILVVCSYSEGFGLTIVEAMAQRKCVIATSVGGICEVVKNNETGVLIEAGNSEILADCLNDIMDDPELREKIGNSAFDECKKNYSINKSVAMLHKYYSDLI